ncbi:MAG: RHS repeat-associated core domain-containing protein [Caldilineaceae bacterium]
MPAAARRRPPNDSRGQVTQQQWVVPGSGGGTFRLDTAYNAAGQKTALTYPGGSGGQLGEVVSFGYDAIGQLTSVGGAAVQYLSGATCNAQGQPLELVNDSGANGLRRQYGYESNTQRLSVLRAGKTSPFTDLQELTYGYDNAGNVTRIVDGRNGSQRQCFQYDWLDRLTGAFTGDAECSGYSGVGVGAYSHSYGYDAIGNLTSYAGSSYTYGGTNDQPHAVTGAYGNSYGYDANGNQVRRTIAGVEYTLVYDYENRLVQVNQSETVIASFLYAADGSRVMGTVDGVTTVYIAGLYEQSGAASTSYYEGGAMRRAGYAGSNGVFYLLTDQLKSTSIIADQAGAEAARQFFYPYGANRGGAAFSELTTKRFTGQYHEQGLPGAEGLSYYNARWYDPQLGRFTSPDTIVPGPANPQNLNRYTYAGNNPVVYDDPSGHCPFCVVLIGAMAAFLMGSGSADVPRPGETRPIHLVEKYATPIKSAGRAFGIDPVMLGAIIDHESTNWNRFGGLGDSTAIILQDRRIAKFSTWSYGLGQVKLAAAKKVEDAGLMPKLATDNERRNALMDNVTNINYTAAKLANDKAQIDAWYKSRQVPIDAVTLNRLTLLSYNQGWDDDSTETDVLDNLKKYGRTSADLIAVTQSLAYEGMIGDVKINDYHTSLMWNSDRISYVERALNVDCSITTR